MAAEVRAASLGIGHELAVVLAEGLATGVVTATVTYVGGTGRFADAEGNPVEDLPVTRMRLSLTGGDSGTTTMVMESVYGSVEAMQQVLDMGMEEGIRAAIGQMDDLLRTSADA